MKNKTNLDYTCIFGGGAIRGISYVGAIKALEDLHVNLNTIAGSSVGAVFAGLMAVGYSASELKDIFMQVNYELFKDIHFGFGKDFALSKGEIFLDWLRELIEKKVYKDEYKKDKNKPVTFSDIEKNLVIITTDLTNFKYKEFSKFVTPDEEIAEAIRISSSMPGLMKPIEKNGALLVDGDLQKSWPLWRLSKNLFPDEDRILEFRLEGDFEGKGKNAINFMNTVYSCVTSLATDFIMQTYGNRDKFDYIKINTGAVVVVDFNIADDKRNELMKIGYDQTFGYFKTELKEKKKNLIKHYKSVYSSIKRIKKLIEKGKISQAKNVLGEFYMSISQHKKFIDLKYYNMIDDFKDKFLLNIVSAPLFGHLSLINSSTINFQISNIEEKLNEAIRELESYIYEDCELK